MNSKSVLLFLFSILYGLLVINFVDLLVSPKIMNAYHLWPQSMYLIPYIPLMIVGGVKLIPLCVTSAIMTSLMNDLLYAPVGILLLNRKYDLVDWYLFQLGFRGFEVRWFMFYGVIEVPVSSLGLGISIYLRILITALLISMYVIRLR